MNVYEKASALHRDLRGKISIELKMPIAGLEELSLLYSPGVAQPCREIAENPVAAYEVTTKGNTIAVVSDGTAVLGLGNIGAMASLPVMEGKAALFKQFAGIDAFPIVLDTTDNDKIVETVKLMSPGFGGINLEDIAAPRCFEIEARLKEELDIPVFHDDQHGTAIVCCAALLNALKLAGKNIQEAKIVLNGAGSAGMAIAKLLVQVGARHLTVCDRNGMVYNDGSVTSVEAFAALVQNRIQSGASLGSLAEAVKGQDVFIGVSVSKVLTGDMVRTMAGKPIIFAMANPEPEILPELASEAGAFIVATGRSDYPNQVNNVVAFPGIFRGALDVRASQINEEMKLAAMHAIAGLVSPDKLKTDYIIPDPFDVRIVPAVAQAVANAARKTGVAGI